MIEGSASSQSPASTDSGNAPLASAFQIRVDNVLRTPDVYGFTGVVEYGTVTIPCTVRRVRVTTGPDSGLSIPIVSGGHSHQTTAEVPTGVKAGFILSYPPEARRKRSEWSRHPPQVDNVYGLEVGDRLVPV